jgi:hypothetical protein
MTNNKVGGGIIQNRRDKAYCDSIDNFVSLMRNPNFKIERVIDSSLSGVVLIVNIDNPALIEELGISILHPTAKDENGNIREPKPMTRFLMKFVFLTQKKYKSFKGVGGSGKDKSTMPINDFLKEIEIHETIYLQSFNRNISLTPGIFFGAIMDQRNSIDFLRDLYEKSIAGVGADILERYYKFVSDPPKKNWYGGVTNKIASNLIGSDWMLGVIAMEFAEDYITLLDHIKNTAGGDEKKMKPPNEEITTSVLKKIFVLYKLGYLHCDDHGNNIMINPNTNDIYIIDFGETIRNPIRDFREYIVYDGSPYQPCDGIKSRFRGYVSAITEEMIQACMNDRSITTADGELIPPDPEIEELKLCLPQRIRYIFNYIREKRKQQSRGGGRKTKKKTRKYKKKVIRKGKRKTRKIRNNNRK